MNINNNQKNYLINFIKKTSTDSSTGANKNTELSSLSDSKLLNVAISKIQEDYPKGKIGANDLNNLLRNLKIPFKNKLDKREEFWRSYEFKIDNKSYVIKCTTKAATSGKDNKTVETYTLNDLYKQGINTNKLIDKYFEPVSIEYANGNSSQKTIKQYKLKEEHNFASLKELKIQLNKELEDVKNQLIVNNFLKGNKYDLAVLDDHGRVSLNLHNYSDYISKISGANVQGIDKTQQTKVIDKVIKDFTQGNLTSTILKQVLDAMEVDATVKTKTIRETGVKGTERVRCIDFVWNDKSYKINCPVTEAALSTDNRVVQTYNPSMLSVMYSADTIKKYFEAAAEESSLENKSTSSKVKLYKLKKSSGCESTNDLNKILNKELEEARAKVFVHNFLNDTNARDSFYDGKEKIALTRKNYQEFISKIPGGNTPGISNEQKEQVVNKLIKDFTQGNVSSLDVLSLLEKVGANSIERHSESQNGSSDYRVSFNFNNVEYNISCNKTAALAKDSRTVKTYTAEELKEMGLSQAIITESFLAVATEKHKSVEITKLYTLKNEITIEKVTANAASESIKIAASESIEVAAPKVIEVGTAEEFIKAIENNPNCNIKLTGDIKITKQIPLFTGTLDGNGKTITTPNKQPLFETIGSDEKQAVIKNLKIDYANKTFQATDAQDNCALADTMKNTVISDIEILNLDGNNISKPILGNNAENISVSNCTLKFNDTYEKSIMSNPVESTMIDLFGKITKGANIYKCDIAKGSYSTSQCRPATEVGTMDEGAEYKYVITTEKYGTNPLKDSKVNNAVKDKYILQYILDDGIEVASYIDCEKNKYVNEGGSGFYTPSEYDEQIRDYLGDKYDTLCVNSFSIEHFNKYIKELNEIADSRGFQSDKNFIAETLVELGTSPTQAEIEELANMLQGVFGSFDFDLISDSEKILNCFDNKYKDILSKYKDQVQIEAMKAEMESCQSLLGQDTIIFAMITGELKDFAVQGKSEEDVKKYVEKVMPKTSPEEMKNYVKLFNSYKTTFEDNCKALADMVTQNAKGEPCLDEKKFKAWITELYGKNAQKEDVNNIYKTFNNILITSINGSNNKSNKAKSYTAANNNASVTIDDSKKPSFWQNYFTMMSKNTSSIASPVPMTQPTSDKITEEIKITYNAIHSYVEKEVERASSLNEEERTGVYQGLVDHYAFINTDGTLRFPAPGEIESESFKHNYTGFQADINALIFDGMSYTGKYILKNPLIEKIGNWGSAACTALSTWCTASDPLSSKTDMGWALGGLGAGILSAIPLPDNADTRLESTSKLLSLTGTTLTTKSAVDRSKLLNNREAELKRHQSYAIAQGVLSAGWLKSEDEFTNYLENTAVGGIKKSTIQVQPQYNSTGEIVGYNATYETYDGFMTFVNAPRFSNVEGVTPKTTSVTFPSFLFSTTALSKEQNEAFLQKGMVVLGNGEGGTEIAEWHEAGGLYFGTNGKNIVISDTPYGKNAVLKPVEEDTELRINGEPVLTLQNHGKSINFNQTTTETRTDPETKETVEKEVTLNVTQSGDIKIKKISYTDDYGVTVTETTTQTSGYTKREITYEYSSNYSLETEITVKGPNDEEYTVTKTETKGENGMSSEITVKDPNGKIVKQDKKGSSGSIIKLENDAYIEIGEESAQFISKETADKKKTSSSTDPNTSELEGKGLASRVAGFFSALMKTFKGKFTISQYNSEDKNISLAEFKNMEAHQKINYDLNKALYQNFDDVKGTTSKQSFYSDQIMAFDNFRSLSGDAKNAVYHQEYQGFLEETYGEYGEVVRQGTCYEIDEDNYYKIDVGFDDFVARKNAEIDEAMGEAMLNLTNSLVKDDGASDELRKTFTSLDEQQRIAALETARATKKAAESQQFGYIYGLNIEEIANDFDSKKETIVNNMFHTSSLGRSLYDYVLNCVSSVKHGSSVLPDMPASLRRLENYRTSEEIGELKETDDDVQKIYKMNNAVQVAFETKVLNILKQKKDPKEMLRMLGDELGLTNDEKATLLAQATPSPSIITAKTKIDRAMKNLSKDEKNTYSNVTTIFLSKDYGAQLKFVSTLEDKHKETLKKELEELLNLNNFKNDYDVYYYIQSIINTLWE